MQRDQVQLPLLCDVINILPNVTKDLFMCPICRQAKQTKMLEFGAEKCLLPDQAKRIRWLVLKNTMNTPKDFHKTFLKAT